MDFNFLNPQLTCLYHINSSNSKDFHYYSFFCVPKTILLENSLYVILGNRHRPKIQYIFLVHFAVKASSKQSLTAHKSLKGVLIAQQAELTYFGP